MLKLFTNAFSCDVYTVFFFYRLQTLLPYEPYFDTTISFKSVRFEKYQEYCKINKTETREFERKKKYIFTISKKNYKQPPMFISGNYQKLINKPF